MKKLVIIGLVLLIYSCNKNKKTPESEASANPSSAPTSTNTASAQPTNTFVFTMKFTPSCKNSSLKVCWNYDHFNPGTENTYKGSREMSFTNFPNDSIRVWWSSDDGIKACGSEFKIIYPVESKKKDLIFLADTGRRYVYVKL